MPSNPLRPQKNSIAPLLRYDSLQLANTVIHELLHNTFYAAGEAQFNESFANFVGARGAIEFFCGRNGFEGKCREARASWADELRFGAFLERLVQDLEALYARPDLSPAQMIVAREEVFRTTKERFATDVKPKFQTRSFGTWDRGTLNNATLIARRLYYHRLDLFERVWEAHGRDLQRTIDAVVEAARGAEDPYASVERLASR